MTTASGGIRIFALIVFVAGITSAPTELAAAPQSLYPSGKSSSTGYLSAVPRKPLDADLIKGSWTLQELIERSGISREEFSKIIGISASAPNSSRLNEIARSLKKSVEDFRELVRRKTPVPKMPGFHPERIRAYWTLGELILLSEIPKKIWAEEIGFPVSTPDNMKLIDIVRPLNKKLEAFRDVARMKKAMTDE